MAKKKQNTGTDIRTVKNSVGNVIVSITDDDMVMIRTEMHGTVISSIVISASAAKELGITLRPDMVTIGELEELGEL
jgi:hypothetical protein